MNLLKGIESFLDDIDHAAAKRLGSDDPNNNTVREVGEEHKTVGTVGVAERRGTGSPARVRPVVVKKKPVKMKTDDEIFAFLNNPSPQASKARKPVTLHPKRSTTTSLKTDLEKKLSIGHNKQSTNKKADQSCANNSNVMPTDTPPSVETREPDTVISTSINARTEEEVSEAKENNEDIISQTKPQGKGGSDIDEDDENDVVKDKEKKEKEENEQTEETEGEDESENEKEDINIEKETEDESEGKEDEEDLETVEHISGDEIDEPSIQPSHISKEELDSILAEREKILDVKSKLEMQNKLMRGEVRSLNDEVSVYSQKITALQAAISESQTALAHNHTAMSEKDRQIERLKATQKDFDNALTAKNQELTTLRLELQEAKDLTKNSANTKQALEDRIAVLEREGNEIIAAHTRAITAATQKSEKLEGILAQERAAAELQKTQAEKIEETLRADVAEYNRVLANLQRRAEDRVTEQRRAAKKAKEAEAAFANLQKEFEEYKERANAVLQEQRNAEGNGSGSDKHDDGFLDGINLELLESRQQCRVYKDEITSAKEEVAELQSEIEELKEKHEDEYSTLQTKFQETSALLAKERGRIEKIQYELLLKTQDIADIREKHNQNNAKRVEETNQLNDTVAALQRKLAMKAAGANSQEELESRMRSMTDQLINLQSKVEALQSEKTAIQHRLDNALHQRKEERPAGRRLSLRGNTDVEGQDKVRMRPIASLVPDSWNDEPESRKQKVFQQSVRAANILDNFSMIALRTLRQYPLWRLFFLLYFVILHMWALFLLSRPLEIHEGHAPV